MFKKIIIIITILLVLLLLVFGYAYITKTDTTTTTGETGVKEENFLFNIFSFGNRSNNLNPIESLVNFITGNTEEEQTILPANKLNRISSMPVSGYGVLEKERYVVVPETNGEVVEGEKVTPTAPQTEFVPILKYADKTNGNIYQTLVENIEERRFSETVIPYIHESFFTKNHVIMRYLRNNSIIATFVGELPKEILGADSSNGNEIFGTFLPEDIKDISVSPDNEQIFYLSNTKNGVIGVLTTDTDKQTKETIFDSHFTEWTSFWPNNEIITLTTKPSGLVNGYSYILNTKTKQYDKALSGIRGLTTLMSPDTSTILYSDNNLSLSLFDINRTESRNLNIKTHPEKCIWAGDSISIYCAVPKFVDASYTYPDSWYMGEVSYNDEIYKINTQTGQKTKLVNPSEIYSDANIDAINLKLDNKEENLFFMNKSDSYLWGLKLN